MTDVRRMGANSARQRCPGDVVGTGCVWDRKAQRSINGSTVQQAYQLRCMAATGKLLLLKGGVLREPQAGSSSARSVLALPSFPPCPGPCPPPRQSPAL